MRKILRETMDRYWSQKEQQRLSRLIAEEAQAYIDKMNSQMYGHGWERQYVAGQDDHFNPYMPNKH